MTNDPDHSKALVKADESAKLLIIEALEGVQTHGFDVDSIFYTDHWIVLEFLRCVTVRPFNSDPARYWHKNWRKFAALWALTKKLDGVLYLVNYEDSREQFVVMKVTDMDPSENGGITSEKKKWTKEQFFEWYRNKNQTATPPWNV